MKKYLMLVADKHGAHFSIAYYTDTPKKNYRVYYCGSDTGERFEYLGNAQRYVEKATRLWEKRDPNLFKIYVTKDEIPRRGSNA